MVKTKNSYINIYAMIEATDQCKLDLPFGVSHQLKPEESTKILGEPRMTNFIGRINHLEKKF